MNVKELREELSMFADDAEVRIAEFGYRTSMQYMVEQAVEVELPDESPGARDDDTMHVVYIECGAQTAHPYLPAEAHDALGR